MEVYCRIRNTGNRAGAEVVQLYVRDLVSSVTTPVKALKAFDKVFLQPGEEKQIKFQVNKNDLRLWNVSKQWVLEPGEFEVYLGASSEDIKLKNRFTVK